MHADLQALHMVLVAALLVHHRNKTSSKMRLALTPMREYIGFSHQSDCFFTSVRVVVLLHQHEASANLHLFACQRNHQLLSQNRTG